MSDKQFEPCSLDEATHVEINGEVHKITERGGMVERSIVFGRIDILIKENIWVNIPKELFPFLGIRCLRMVKPKPIEFEATFVMYDGKWHPLYSWNAGVSYQNSKKATFKCVQILEEEE